MQWNVLISEKEWPTDLHNNMNESCRHTVKQIKSGIKAHKLYEFIFLKFKDKTNPWWLY